MSQSVKLAVYLDELDEDPIKACAMANGLGVTNICIRRVWSTNISKATDEACKSLMAAIRQNKLTVVAVCVEDGKVPITSLNFDKNVQRGLTIASYFKAKMFRPFIGQGSPTNTQTPNTLTPWMAAIGGECIKSGIIPIVEIDPDSYIFEPADVAKILADNPTWRLLYDPALLIARRNQDPLVKYWYLLRQKVVAIDLHDFKVGSGFVPLGSGSCRWEDTIRDAVSSTYNGWYIVEPGTTRRHGVVTPRLDIVKYAISSLLQMVAKSKETLQSWRP